LGLDAHGRSNIVLQLTPLTLLIDPRIISIDEAVERMEQIHSSLADQMPGYADPMVLAGVKYAIDWLRLHKKEPRPRRKLALVQ